MNDNLSPDLYVDDSPAANRTSRILLILAIVTLAGSCLLTSPVGFSQAHEQDTSLLKPIVTMLGLGGAFPTPRGIEIRELIYFCGAALIALVAGVRLMTSSRRPRIAFDDLLDVRRRASSPMFWWFLLLLVSAISSYYSHAPEICRGQSIIRFMHAAWWWPLAALLIPRHVSRLASSLLIILGLVGGLGIWYHLSRDLPDARLQYPIGNQLWLAACLLPGLFIALGLVVARWKSIAATKTETPANNGPAPLRIGMPIILSIICFALVIGAIYLTKSRSAGVGIIAGVCAIAFLCAQRQNRLWTVLVCLILALGGAMFVQSLRLHGVMGDRAHSVRARLDHEWPYALSLFYQKPIAGHGDGAYSMLAGQYAREEQIDDPAILSFDGWSWVARAHNEYLELLADLGLIGMVSFIMAIITTLYVTTRYCDQRRGDPARAAERWLVIGLAAACFALAVDSFSENAFREPGLPPIWLGVWAMLWAAVRATRGSVEVEKDEQRRMGLPLVRLTGTAIGMGAVALLIFAVQNWRAERAHWELQRAVENGEYETAVERADFAAQHTLHPFRNLLARVYGISAKAAEFESKLRASDGPPSKEVMNIGMDAIMQVNAMQKLAPRFLRLSQLEAGLALSLARAHERLGEPKYVREKGQQFAAAMTRYRADEPFNQELVRQLWRIRHDANVGERLEWLRCLLRRGEFDEEFVQLLAELANRPDFVQAWSDLFNIAMKDRERPPMEWSDRLTPETFRIAALLMVFNGKPAEAAQYAEQAAMLYNIAGPRLFAAHSAALHETVRYRLNAAPTEKTDDNLRMLAESYAVLAKRVPPTEPLPGSLGETRLKVLLGANREDEAKLQLEKLQPQAETSMETQLATAYRVMAEGFIERPEFGDVAMAWTRRAIELAPDFADAYIVEALILLRRGDDAEALKDIQAFLAKVNDKPAAYRYLAGVEMRYAGSGVWDELRKTIPDYPAPPQQPTTEAPTTTSPATETPATEQAETTTEPAPETPAAAEPTADGPVVHESAGDDGDSADAGTAGE